MRVITNESRLRRGRFLATSLSIAGLLMLASSWVGVVFFRQATLSTLPLLGLGIAFSLVGIRFSRKWVRAPQPHKELASSLKGIGKDSVLLNYWQPASHIILTRDGIFSLTVRNQPFDLLINGSDWKDNASTGERLRRTFAMDMSNNPLREAEREGQRASVLLSDLLGKQVAVQPLVVFINPKTHLEVVEQSDIPVVYADKRKPSLKTYLKTGQQTSLSAEDIETIVSSLGTS